MHIQFVKIESIHTNSKHISPGTRADLAHNPQEIA